MNEKQKTIWEYTDQLVDIANHWNDFTTSDLQGTIEAVVMQVYDAGRGSKTENPIFKPIADIMNILTRLTEKVERANSIQHSGGRVLAGDWAELYTLTNEARKVIKNNLRP